MDSGWSYGHPEFVNIDLKKDSRFRMLYSLAKIGYAILSGDTKLQVLVVPPSIDSISKIDSQAFIGSSLTSVVFLGFSSLLSSSIQSTGMFGVGHDCRFVTSDGTGFTWNEASQIVEVNKNYNQLGSANVSSGKQNRMKLGRLYKFKEELYQWCMDPSLQDTSKYLHPAQCPMIIIYGDFKTSSRSMRFLKNILENESFAKWLKDEIKCYLFLVDRSGIGVDGSFSSNSDYIFFKSIRPSSVAQDFVSIDFIYKSNYVSKTFASGSLLDFKLLVTAGMDEAGFSAFDYEAFDVVILEDPYIETIPTTTPSVWMTPWWWNGSSPQTVPDWNPS